MFAALVAIREIASCCRVLQVYHPQYSSSHSTDSETSKLEAMRKGFDNLRKEKALTDVVFIAHEATDDDLHPEDSQPLVAHRAFLAALSEYFSDSFCGGFAESRVASPEDPVQLNVSDHSRQCVQLVLDYIYTGIRSTDSASLDLLLETMQLSGYWRINDLFEDMQKEIVTRRLITPLTLDASELSVYWTAFFNPHLSRNIVRDAAEVSHAENLVHTCTEYEERNSAFIQKVRQSTVVDPGNL
ncbi:hypothetical protein BDZ97DRAFT_1410625 [Flammula alnicola]|nr:hypothetical protein BDZ97DRAFT_1410625 [Flammula alnicola]